MITELRARAKERIQELDGILGVRRTEEGAAPYLFQDEQELDELELDPRYPLARIVSILQKRHPEARLGVVVRACDLRALVEMAKRQQVFPERLTVLAAACGDQEADACYCADPAPQLAGWPQAELIGTPGRPGPQHPLVAEYENMALAERGAFWRQQFAKCIKCYGCRNICPECFCESCTLENPLWVEKGVLSPAFPTYHLIRAMHMSGRCVACRQCELACPAHIPLTVLHDLIRRDVEELLDYVPGCDLEAPPPMSLNLEEAPLRVESK